MNNQSANRILGTLFCAGAAMILSNCGGELGPLYDDAFEQAKLDAEAVVQALKGNGTPSGAHFNLNIIGMEGEKVPEMGSGHRIFVKMKGNTKINLSEGQFGVIDGNGTDGTAAFQLPNPDPENDGITTYSVFARALGKPGGSSTMTTCATELDAETGIETDYCSIMQSVQFSDKGKKTFENVSNELLYVYADIDGDGIVERRPLFAFDGDLVEYYWDYNNRDLRLLQLRFYEVPTNVN